MMLVGKGKDVERFEIFLEKFREELVVTVLLGVLCFRF